MNKMSRQQELDVIENTRKLLCDKSAVVEIREWYRDHVGDEIKLDRLGADIDAMGKMPAIGNKNPSLKTSSIQSLPNVLFMSAMMRCMQNTCRHIGKQGAEAMFAFLAPRLMSCQDCISSFLSLFAKCDADKVNANECDLCLKLHVEKFFEFSVAWNGVVFMGDICEECHALLKGCDAATQ